METLPVQDPQQADQAPSTDLSLFSRRLFITSLLFLIVLLLTVGIIQARRGYHAGRAAMNDTANTSVDFLEKVGSVYIENYDLTALERFIQIVAQDRDCVAAVYFDTSDSPLTVKYKMPKETKGLLILERPIQNIRGRTIGKIKLAYSYQRLEDSFRQALYITFGGLLVAILLLSAATTLINRTIEKVKLEMEVKKLVEALRKKNTQIQALYQYTSMLSTTLKLEEISMLSAKAMNDLTGSVDCVYYHFDSSKKLLRASGWTSEEALATKAAPEIEWSNPPTGSNPQQKISFNQNFKHLLAKGFLASTSMERLKLLLLFNGDVFIGVFSLLMPSTTADINEEDAEIVKQYMQNVSVQLQNALLHETIHGLAVRDGLTDLFNHRYFQNALDSEILRAIRFKKSFSIILFDIDHFKHYNDANGHPAGDKLLQEIAMKIMQSSRGTDTYARYGGEEFVIILPETNKEGAAIRAEKLRAEIANHPFFNASAQPLECVSISGGYAEFPLDAESKPALIKLVDQALYRAKKAGRNRMLSV